MRGDLAGKITIFMKVDQRYRLRFFRVKMEFYPTKRIRELRRRVAKL